MDLELRDSSSKISDFFLISLWDEGEQKNHTYGSIQWTYGLIYLESVSRRSQLSWIYRISILTEYSITIYVVYS